jgi:hypothetical protein
MADQIPAEGIGGLTPQDTPKMISDHCSPASFASVIPDSSPELEEQQQPDEPMANGVPHIVNQPAALPAGQDHVQSGEVDMPNADDFAWLESLTPEQMEQLIQGMDGIEDMLANEIGHHREDVFSMLHDNGLSMLAPGVGGQGSQGQQQLMKSFQGADQLDLQGGSDRQAVVAAEIIGEGVGGAGRSLWPGRSQTLDDAEQRAGASQQISHQEQVTQHAICLQHQQQQLRSQQAYFPPPQQGQVYGYHQAQPFVFGAQNLHHQAINGYTHQVTVSPATKWALGVHAAQVLPSGTITPSALALPSQMLPVHPCIPSSISNLSPAASGAAMLVYLPSLQGQQRLYSSSAAEADYLAKLSRNHRILSRNEMLHRVPFNDMILDSRSLDSYRFMWCHNLADREGITKLLIKKQRSQAQRAVMLEGLEDECTRGQGKGRECQMHKKLAELNRERYSAVVGNGGSAGTGRFVQRDDLEPTLCALGRGVSFFEHAQAYCRAELTRVNDEGFLAAPNKKDIENAKQAWRDLHNDVRVLIAEPDAGYFSLVRNWWQTVWGSDDYILNQLREMQKSQKMREDDVFKKPRRKAGTGKAPARKRQQRK